MRDKWIFAGIVIVVSLLYSLFSSQAKPEGTIPEQPITSTSSSVSAAAVALPTIATEPAKTYAVVKVVDGDTLAISIDGKSVTLRLIGLDTPETVDPRKPVQCFGKAASDKAKELLRGKRVSIEKDTSQGELDKYGRTLAYVFLPNGTLFNEYMITQGFGHEYTYDTPYKYQEAFKAAEANARANKRGLWADDACAAASSRTPVSPIHTTPSPMSGQYDCTHNIYNCSSFKSQADAQAAFDVCGGSNNDIHKLDSDKDSKVCESLP